MAGFNPHWERASCLQPQWPRLGQTLFKDCRRAGYSPGHHRWVVVVHEGRTNFSELQAELAGGRQYRLLYDAF
jgi:hypothetical protein